MHPDQKIDSPPSRVSFWLLPLLVVVAAVLLVVAMRPTSKGPVGSTHTSVGGGVTALELEPLLHAREGLTLDDVRGKVTLINFWGPWCPPCLMELPELVELEKQYRDHDDVAILLVSSSGGSGEDIEELREDTRDTMRKFKSDAAIFHDESNVSKRWVIESAKLPNFGFPTTIILDREGKISGVWQGYRPEYIEEMRDVIEQALSREAA